MTISLLDILLNVFRFEILATSFMKFLKIDLVICHMLHVCLDVCLNFLFYIILCSLIWFERSFSLKLKPYTLSTIGSGSSI